MFKNVAAKFMVFAWDTTTGVAKTGDAANITAYVSKDYGAVTVLGDTAATEMDATNAKGYYLFDAAQAETNADCLMVSAKSATANIAVVGAPAVIYTRPTTGWLAPTTAGRTLTADASGNVTLADGVAHGGALASSTATMALSRIYVQSQSADTAAVVMLGNGSGAGLNARGGATGIGGYFQGGATSGDALVAAAQTSGHGFSASGAGTTKHGISALGGATTSAGISAVGGATSGDGIRAIASTSGKGISATGAGTTQAGIAATGGATSSAGITATGGGTGSGIVATSGSGATGDGIQATAASTNGNGMALTKTGSGVSLAAPTTNLVLAKTTNITGFNDIAATDIVSAGAITTSSGAVSLVTTTTTATNVTTVNGLAANVITATSIAADAITAAKIANGAIDAATFAADVDAEILSYIVDDATRIDASALNTASVTSIPAILADTGTDGVVVAAASKTGYSLTATTGLGNQTADITGTITTVTNLTNLPATAALEATLTDMKGATFDTATDSLEALRNRGDAAWITATGFATSGALTTAQADLDILTGADGVIIASGTQTFNMTGSITGNLSGSVGSVTGAVGSVTGAVGSVTGAVGSVTGAVGSVTGSVGSVTGLTASDVGAIKTKTDSLSFTVAGKVDANITHVIADPVQVSGSTATNWGGAP